MSELIGVTLKVVCPNVLDLVPHLGAVSQLDVGRGEAGPDADVVRDPGEDLVELPAVLLVDVQVVVRVEVLVNLEKIIPEDRGEFRDREPADVATLNMAYCIVE